MDTCVAIDRIETIMPELTGDLKPLLETVIREARYMQVIRELVAGQIDIEDALDAS